MKNNIIILILIFLSSCNKSVNQYIKNSGNSQQRHGKWVEKYPVNDGEMVASGKYKNGEKTGVWKTFYNHQLYQKDKTINGVTKTKIFHPNGRIMEKGQSRLDVTENGRHWCYYGDWKYYDENGKLEMIKKYDKGKKTDSVAIKR